jgi:hypothetical protein
MGFMRKSIVNDLLADLAVTAEGDRLRTWKFLCMVACMSYMQATNSIKKVSSNP